MSKSGGVYVDDDGQNNGAEDEAKIRIHDTWSLAVRWKKERDEVDVFSEGG